MKNWTYRELLKKDVLRGHWSWLPRRVGWCCLQKDSHGCLQHGACVFGLVSITEKKLIIHWSKFFSDKPVHRAKLVQQLPCWLEVIGVLQLLQQLLQNLEYKIEQKKGGGHAGYTLRFSLVTLCQKTESSVSLCVANTMLFHRGVCSPWLRLKNDFSFGPDWLMAMKKIIISF